LKTLSAIVVDPDATQAASTVAALNPSGLRCHVCSSAKEALATFQALRPAVVITELVLPDSNGVALMRKFFELDPHIPILIVTGEGTSESALEATKQGAYDYLLKPVDPDELAEIVSRAAEAGRRMRTPVEIEGDAKGGDTMIGRSRAMQEVYKELGRVAAKPVSVLIRGETGTGKELAARAIYQHGHRAHLPFVTVNCAAIPETLLESELFGHEKGAFTGADSRRIGRFEQANNGTIFLDEIGEISAGTQAKLLRVLQERTLQRLGGREDIPVDVRVIAATNRDLERAIEERQFRADLYYRLNAVTITLPPLRSRREDIPFLARHFARLFGEELGVPAAIDQDAVDVLVEQPWPGNVRQLQNVIRQALLRCRGYPITGRLIHEIMAEVPATAEGGGLEVSIRHALGEAASGRKVGVYGELVQTFEKTVLSHAMKLSRGNLSRAARWLGISRLTLREKLNQYGLRPGVPES
jgi:DNA-binding NtrC family response regulator